MNNNLNKNVKNAINTKQTMQKIIKNIILNVNR